MPPFFVFWILLNNLLSIACLPDFLADIFLPIGFISTAQAHLIEPCDLKLIFTFVGFFVQTVYSLMT